MIDPDNCLGETSIEEFLADYWQKKPLLIRDAFPGLESPISAEELAGLSCEEHVNGRLVLERDGDYPWQVEFGPFEESRFSQLPESHWSLLVSDVEKHVPETAVLLKPFRFIPDWRIDDLMISYAPQGGSVGAHTDAYDVFLIQLSGQRLWKIAEEFPDRTLDGVDLCILEKFEAENEWLLNSGDMLYLPPNIAHHGIALDNGEPCLTASVGFRAPSLKTITSDYINYLNENVHDERRYRDAVAVKPKHHAEITDQTVAHFIDYLKQGISIEHDQVKNWLGQYCSDNKTYEEMIVEQHIVSYDELTDIARRHPLQRSPYSNFLFSYNERGAILFVNGGSHQVSSVFAESICESDAIDLQQLNEIITADDKITLLVLYNTGALISE
ncbi:MAG: cupin domain-containing protein [Gammaproteobacteria bacterium]|nr:cupin domain-containing protein [Gammaproteobacteria bacterium]NNJ49186.1 cupin domain-containing protein [Gammaproteobacteria bacterium]